MEHNTNKEALNKEIIENIHKKVKKDSKTADELAIEFKNIIKKIDDLVDNFYNKHIKDKSLSDNERKQLVKIHNITLEEISKEKNQVTLFNDYVLSYFHSCILIRNEMIANKKPILFYSYMFNMIHYLELVIKYLYISNVTGFLNTDTTHKILDLYEEKKDEILALGITENYYEELIKMLKKIKKMINVDDFAMGFKYPVNKDFKTKIINEKEFKLSDNELTSIINEHKLLLFIVLDIYILGICSNYNDLIKDITEKYEKNKKEIFDEND